MPKPALALSLAAGLSLAGAALGSVPTISILPIDLQASEVGADSASVVVMREGASIDQPLTVPIALSGSATPGVDYASPGPSITFPAHSPIVNLSIQPVPDALVEGPETVVLTLLEKKGSYVLDGGRKSAQIAIADGPRTASGPRQKPGKAGEAPASGPGTGTGRGSSENGTSSPDNRHPQGSASGPIPDPADPLAHRLPPADRTGFLHVSVTLDGSGHWKRPTTGEYADHKFHRVLTYTVPLRGVFGAASGFAQIDKREAPKGFAIPNLRRYLALQPVMVSADKPCGRGTIDLRDVWIGMESGDPGMPPLVPFTHTEQAGGRYPTGDKSVTERNLCGTRIAFDLDKRVYHLRLEGGETFVKVQTTHNGFQPRPFTKQIAGYDATEKLTLFDLPLPTNALSLEGTRTFESFAVARGMKGVPEFPLRATVNWRITTQDAPAARRNP